MMNICMRSVVVITALGFTTSTAAQPDKAAKAKQEKLPSIDPAAIAALEAMGAFLRDQKSFTVKMKSETDHVLDNGQKIRLSGRGDLQVRRPDRLRAEVISDRKQRQFFYDGKTFTMNAQQVGVYTTVPAPPTLADLAGELEDKYGIELPLVDLFYWGSDKADTKQITMATYIGESAIDGIATDQYAFRQPGLDWQIWIERGSKPVPRKLVLTTTDDPKMPEHEIEMAWDLDAKHDDKTFAFTPSKDAKKIAIVDISPQRSAEATKRPVRRPPR